MAKSRIKTVWPHENNQNVPYLSPLLLVSTEFCKIPWKHRNFAATGSKFHVPRKTVVPTYVHTFQLQKVQPAEVKLQIAHHHECCYHRQPAAVYHPLYLTTVTIYRTIIHMSKELKLKLNNWKNQDRNNTSWLYLKGLDIYMLLLTGKPDQWRFTMQQWQPYKPIHISK